MKYFLFLSFASALLFISCMSGKKIKATPVTQGIEGFVKEETGNRMPMRDVPPYQPKLVSTTVYIYEPTNLTQVARVGQAPLYSNIYTKLVATVKSDSLGHFAVSLPVGAYSVFVKAGSNFFANLFDTNNNISLYQVAENKLTQVNITINTSAAY